MENNDSLHIIYKKIAFIPKLASPDFARYFYYNDLLQSVFNRLVQTPTPPALPLIFFCNNTGFEC